MGGHTLVKQRSVQVIKSRFAARTTVHASKPALYLRMNIHVIDMSRLPTSPALTADTSGQHHAC